MKELRLDAASGSSRLLLGASLDRLGDVAGDRRAVVISDENVARLYGSRFPAAERLIVPPGEESKTLDQARVLYGRLVAAEVDRETLVIGIGGGVVCDLAGFVAATFLRGLACGFVPTTLLAQVDASIGGKNGVNLARYKNLVGTIVQPRFVLVDPGLLETLPPAEIRCGLAELVKAAAIRDAALFATLEERGAALLAATPEVLGELVARAVAVKAAVVAEDERESGVRRLLNFGHTFGHALERATALSHGEAVSVGMVVAARLSVARGLLPATEAERLERLLETLGLPTRAPADAELLADAMRRDKKRSGDVIRFVLLERIGRAVVAPIPLKTLAATVGGLAEVS